MKESQSIEFKESWRDEHIKSICAFANSKGGRILIGINDEGSVIGVKNSKKLLEDIPNKTTQLLGITIDIDLRLEKSKEIIEIIVFQSSVPVSFNSRYYIRSGSTVQELKGQKLREFILKKDNLTWDEIVVNNTSLEDVDKKLFLEFITKATYAKRLPPETLQEDISLTLAKLNLITDSGELTRAAILLFGIRPGKYIHTATLKIGRFGKSDADLISQDIIDGNILEMPDKIMEIIRVKYLHTLISYTGIERIETLEYPEKALREAILNAIVHRDYGDKSDITIRVFDDRIVIWNSGQLIEPLTIEMLNQDHPSKRRNAIIADIFFLMGYIEAWGRGIFLIKSETKKLNLPEPLIEESAGGIKITFFKSLNNVPDNVPDNVLDNVPDNVPDKRLSLIIDLIKQNNNILIQELSKKLKVSKRTIRRDIEKLKLKKFIKRIGSEKSGHWEIAKK